MIEFKPNQKEQKFNSREFLNDLDSRHTGSMKVEMTIERKVSKAKVNPGTYYSIWGSVEIRDCSRRIDLNLDGDTRQGKKKLINTKEKLRKIRDMCDEAMTLIDKLEAHTVTK